MKYKSGYEPPARKRQQFKIRTRKSTNPTKQDGKSRETKLEC